MNKRLKAVEPKWLLVIVFFISGIFLGGIIIYLWYGVSATRGYKIRSDVSSYKYINPLLAVEFEQSRLFGMSTSIDLKLNGVVDAAKRNGSIFDASVYYRDLEPGSWAGVNENTSFSPGKLLKIPLMIAYYKLGEVDPSVLQKQIINTQRETNSKNLFPPNEELVSGQSYTVEELISRMIVSSDDTAANLLFDNIDKKALEEIFSDLGISFIEDKETTDYLPVKLYSLFFRVLYNATYLNREYSEKAMTLLDVDVSNKNIGTGLGVPKEILFVQKYGGRKYIENGEVRYELHDCGIVYYPDHPYLLCSSAKGSTISGIENFFKNISKEVYAETKYKYKE